MPGCACCTGRCAGPRRARPRPLAACARCATKTAAWDKRAPYGEADVRALLEAAEPRTRALLLLCAHGGLRISEALTLTWEDVDLPGRELVVRAGKGGKRRRVVFGATRAAALDGLPRDGAVIGGSYPAAVERLRHYAGTRPVREGATLDDVARHLGHSALETTRIYAQWSDDALRARVAGW